MWQLQLTILMVRTQAYKLHQPYKYDVNITSSMYHKTMEYNCKRLINAIKIFLSYTANKHFYSLTFAYSQVINHIDLKLMPVNHTKKFIINNRHLFLSYCIHSRSVVLISTLTRTSQLLTDNASEDPARVLRNRCFSIMFNLIMS